MHRLRLTGCLTVLLLGVLAGRVPAEEPRLEVSKAAWSALDQTARALAGAGRGTEREVLLDVARELGRDTEALGRLRERCEKALRRGKRKAANDKKAAKALEKAVGALLPGLGAAPEDQRARLAGLLLRLDDKLEAAHEAAGHVEKDGAWTLPWMVPLLDRRRAVTQAVRDARKLELAIETGPSAHPLFKALYGRDGFQASWKNISVHSVNLGADRLERVLRQTLRAFALSNWLRDGTLTVPPRASTYRGFNLASRADYLRAVDYAVETGGIPAAEAESYRSMAWLLHAKGGYAIVGYRNEATIEASLFDDLLTETAFGGAQPCLYVGHLNWVCQAVLGTWAPTWVYDESAERKERASPSSSPADREERKRAELVAQAGLAGSRTYLRYLAQRREDPPWSNAMLDKHGKIKGTALLKTTMITEFLQERGDLQTLAKSTATAPQGIPQSFEDALSMPLGEFEHRWRTWLLPPDTSIARRLASSGDEDRSLPASLQKLLSHLHDVRVRSMETPQEDVLPPLTLDTELSAGCEAHARYLDRNPAQKSQWPEAHEEFPDKQGFSPAGSMAGLNSVIAYGEGRPTEFTDQWLATFYHRLPLLHPGLRRIGWGLAEQVAVLDCASMVTDRVYQVQARWPHEGQTSVPRSFQPEMPNPVPGKDQSAWGYPITLQNYAQEWDTNRLRMHLFRGSAKAANEVECHFISPEVPLNPELAPAQTWCLIPKQTLAAKQRYVVVVRGIPQKPNWTWTFTTGR